MSKYIFVLKSEAAVLYREKHNCYPMMSSPDVMIAVIGLLEEKYPGYEFLDYVQDGKEFIVLRLKPKRRKVFVK